MAAPFLQQWERESPESLRTYRALAQEEGTLADFNVNPLAVMLVNRPACCISGAEDFLRSSAEPAVKRLKAGALGDKATGRGEEDDLATHLCASMLTGLVTTTVTNPVDMIKTQLYVSAGATSESRKSAPGGAVAAARDVLRRQGPRGFMRGWTANYLRLGPQTVITFVALEQLRRLAGMDAL